jgi:hypothetical protein
MTLQVVCNLNINTSKFFCVSISLVCLIIHEKIKNIIIINILQLVKRSRSNVYWPERTCLVIKHEEEHIYTSTAVVVLALRYKFLPGGVATPVGTQYFYKEFYGNNQLLLESLLL